MFRHVNVVGTINIPVPKKDLVKLLWNIKRIPEFDLKADHVEVRPETSGFYAVKGRFASYCSDSCKQGKMVNGKCACGHPHCK